MKIELLKLAASILRDRVRIGFFNMGVWGAIGECGFAGCALGHLTQHAEFHALGLFFNFPDVTFSGEYNLRAAMKLFEIGEDTAACLFVPNRYVERAREITPGMVAARIDKIIHEYERMVNDVS
jgi:hypothetical protein